MEITQINTLSGEIISAALEVHNTLGPGLLDKCYVKALAYELETRGHEVKRNVNVHVSYKGIELTDENTKLVLDCGLVVDNLICIDVKSIEAIEKVNTKQLSTYIQLLELPLGLLLNFNVNRLMKEGFQRITNAALYYGDKTDVSEEI